MLMVDARGSLEDTFRLYALCVILEVGCMERWRAAGGHYVPMAMAMVMVMVRGIGS